MSPHPDLAVASRILVGERAAFEALVRAHQAGMARLARIYTRRDAVAEEVVQEAWLAALTGLRRYEGRSSLKSWLYAIVANRARERARQEGRLVLLDGPDDSPDPLEGCFAPNGHWQRLPDDFDTPEDILAARRAADARHRAIEAALAALPERQRAVLTLRDLEDLDGPEVAALLGISEGNQRVLLHRARIAFRAALVGGAS